MTYITLLVLLLGTVPLVSPKLQPIEWQINNNTKDTVFTHQNRRHTLPLSCQDIEHKFKGKNDTFYKCLRELNKGPQPFTCADVDDLAYESKRAFATGTKKEVFHAQFRGLPVVVKRPRLAQLHGEDVKVTARLFRDEAILFTLLRDEHHPRFLGSCLDPAMNVVERVTPWRLAIPTASLRWTDRVRIALGLTDILEYWETTTRGPLVHCDFYTFQFALDANKAPVVVDIDGLMRSPHDHMRPCQTDADCEHSCWRGHHYKPDRYGEFERPDEVRCRRAANSRVNGTCPGFTAKYNIFTVCRILFYDLFYSPTTTPPLAELAPHPDRAFTLAIDALMRQCAQPSPFDRPTVAEIRQTLRDLLKKRGHSARTGQREDLQLQGGTSDGAGDASSSSHQQQFVINDVVFREIDDDGRARPPGA